MYRPGYPWGHVDDGARHMAMCSYGCGLIVEWRGSVHPSAATLAKVAKHVEACPHRPVEQGSLLG